MPDMIYVPVPAELYNDAVRFSDGRFDLIDFALDQFHEFIRRTADDNCHGIFGDRLNEFLVKYHPDIVARWEDDDTASIASREEKLAKLAPLMWKEVVIPGGSHVRMQYGGAFHTARVVRGTIKDEAGEFSPSEWACKVANHTNRNAWRDLSFRLPGSTDWISATTLRERAQAEIARLVGNVDIGEL